MKNNIKPFSVPPRPKPCTTKQIIAMVVERCLGSRSIEPNSNLHMALEAAYRAGYQGGWNAKCREEEPDLSL